MVKQSAFVFAKPHANTPAFQAKIKEVFEAKGISIVEEGEITGPDIDSNKYIDQHYYAIASKATIMPAKDLNVPADKFKDTFGEEWAAAVADDRVHNALDIKTKLGWESDKLNAEWDKTSDKASPKTRVKFGGGFYCGQLDVDGKKYYTFNAFFMEMRGKFTQAGESIHYFVVEFEDTTLAWSAFRGEVLGPTNPAEAPSGSLRGIVNADWEALGLKSAPNTGDNAVHASASPFEGLAERTNWLASKYTLQTDAFAVALKGVGISEETMKAWSVDPQVPIPGAEGKKSLFDQVEDMDFDACVAKLKEINEASA